MKTAEDVISASKEMPIEEQRKVVDFLNFEMEEKRYLQEATCVLYLEKNAITKKSSFSPLEPTTKSTNPPFSPHPFL